MMGPNGRRRSEQWWRYAALLGVVLIIVTALGIAHCSYDNGMSPDFCAMTAVMLMATAPPVLALSGRLRSDAAPALVPVPLALLERPPEIARS
jgi:hypothetical protein